MAEEGVQKNLEAGLEKGLERKEGVGEKMPSPEVVVEKKPETPAEREARFAPPVTPVTAAPAKDQVLQNIETILEEDLEQIYFSMNSAQQKQFKKQGEKAAIKIMDLLKKAHVNIKKIINVIREWLKLIPGINRFFLEQEAKIKADKIIEIKNQNK